MGPVEPRVAKLLGFLDDLSLYRKDISNSYRRMPHTRRVGSMAPKQRVPDPFVGFQKLVLSYATHVATSPMMYKRQRGDDWKNLLVLCQRDKAKFKAGSPPYLSR